MSRLPVREAESGIARFVTERQASEYLGLSDRMVRKLRTQGKLPSYKFGESRRYKLDDLDAYAEARLDTEEAVA